MKTSSILFITTNNLATNPRLCKEMDLASSAGARVTVILFHLDNWSDEIDYNLKEKYPGINFMYLNAGRHPCLPWLISSILEKAARILTRFLKMPLLFSCATGKRSLLIERYLRKINGSYDWVIAHNPAAFYPSLEYAKRNGIKLGIDIEDYHPGETNDQHLSFIIKRMMSCCLPYANYVSFAAPLIQKEVEKDFNIKQDNWFTLLNYFPSTEFAYPDTLSDGPLKLVWFSQNINAGRGLEHILPSVKQFTGKVELHLIGHLDESFGVLYLQDSMNIFIHKPMSQSELHFSLKNYDVGLAIDIAVDRNRELALSNKMLSFLQSGLFLVATNTLAQDDFLSKFPGHGFLYDYKAVSFEKILDELIVNLSLIRNTKVERYKSFHDQGWENEAIRLLSFWQK